MKSEVRLTLEFLAGVFISLFILILMGIDSDFGTILMFVGGIVAVIIIEMSRGKKQAAAKDYLDYDAFTETLTVKARKPENANVIKVEEMFDCNLNYHPSKIVYTGATVGGVHTGGFHDAGNYYTLDGTSTNKYHLIYKGLGVTSEDYCPIKQIKLDRSLVEAAKENPVISRYLNADGTLTLSNNVASKYSEHVGTAVKHGNVDLVMQLAKADYFNQQLSKEQCKAIKNWISGLN